MVTIGTLAIIGLSIPSTIISDKSEAEQKILATNIVLSDTPTDSEIKLAIRDITIKYGLNYEEFYYTIQHESSFNPNAVGIGGFSIGIAQFTLPTWLGNCGSVDERLDPIKSIECMGKLWAKGQEYRWDAFCYKYKDEKCISKRGLYPK